MPGRVLQKEATADSLDAVVSPIEQRQSTLCPPAPLKSLTFWRYTNQITTYYYYWVLAAIGVTARYSDTDARYESQIPLR